MGAKKLMTVRNVPYGCSEFLASFNTCSLHFLPSPPNHANFTCCKSEPLLANTKDDDIYLYNISGTSYVRDASRLDDLNGLLIFYYLAYSVINTVSAEDYLLIIIVGIRYFDGRGEPTIVSLGSVIDTCRYPRRCVLMSKICSFVSTSQRSSIPRVFYSLNTSDFL